MIILIIYFILKSRNYKNAYKIENNYFEIKTIRRIWKFNISELSEFYEIKGNISKLYTFQFGEKKFNIYYDDNTKELIDFFYENYFEDFYKKKKLEYDIENVQYPKRKKNKLRIHIILGIILFFYTVFSIVLSLKNGDYIIQVIIDSILFWQFWFIRLHRILNERKYFDKEGFHEIKYVIPYSEIRSIIEIEKKILTLRHPIIINYLKIITDAEELNIEDNISCNISYYKYIKEKIKQNKK